jgi:class 3 adenylate cyclase
MTKARSASFARPHEVRDFDHGRLLLVHLGDEAVGRQVLDPGWRWSVHVKPVVGTAKCEIHHIGLMLSGHLRAEMADGSVLEVGPDEVYELPPGHDAWVVGDEPAVSLHWSGIRTFGATVATSRQRALTTVLFTDIVDSTDVAARLGDERWQDLLATYNETVRRVFDRFAGVEITATGDGFLARFDTPAGAIHCAEAIRAAIVDLGLEMRAAVHTGEVELVGDDIRGVAIHLASRILALERPGEILVSATTHDLADGSGLKFEDHGRHILRGISGERSIFRVGQASDPT